jgi:hypothetical protein
MSVQTTTIAAELPGHKPAALPGTWRELLLPTIWVLAAFLVFSAVRAPVPSANETHYLAKAKRYWDSDFCPGDFFLDSSSPHLVFYQSVGLLTKFLTLKQTAVVGRIIGHLLLAVGWTALVSRLIPGRWSALGAAVLFLAMAAVGNFAGEWMVGGVEAKVFSYAFLFLAMAAVADRRLIRAGLYGGLSITFHPLVGIWAGACAIFAGIVTLAVHRRDGNLHEPSAPSLSTAVLALLALAVSALPGLLPAFQLLGAVPAGIQFQADYILVFYRLKHHLDPMEFTNRQYAGYGALLLLWLAGSCKWKPRRVDSWFAWFVFAAVIVAMIGLAVGIGERPADKIPYHALKMKVRLLKFYPFRLADVLLPIACSVVIVSLSANVKRLLSRTAGYRIVDKCWGTCLLLAGVMVFALTVPSRSWEPNPSRMHRQQLADWKNACRWISKNTPGDAQFWTPQKSWAFKWYAQRAEYVVHKDCPQDAAGIVEWNRRRIYLAGWKRLYFRRGYSMAALHALQQETGVTHILASRRMRLPLEPLYGNKHYRVYRLSRNISSP